MASIRNEHFIHHILFDENPGRFVIQQTGIENVPECQVVMIGIRVFHFYSSS
jgi:hypothetical protein